MSILETIGKLSLLYLALANTPLVAAQITETSGIVYTTYAYLAVIKDTGNHAVQNGEFMGFVTARNGGIEYLASTYPHPANPVSSEFKIEYFVPTGNTTTVAMATVTCVVSLAICEGLPPFICASVELTSFCLQSPECNGSVFGTQPVTKAFYDNSPRYGPTFISGAQWFFDSKDNTVNVNAVVGNFGQCPIIM